MSTIHNYTVMGDTFGPTPYLIVTIDGVADMHHAKGTAAARRVAQYLWGNKGSAKRLSNGRYELVYLGVDVPLPGFMEAKYGRYSMRGTIGID